MADKPEKHIYEELIADFVSGEYTSDQVEQLISLLQSDKVTVRRLLHHIALKNRLSSVKKITCPTKIIEQFLDQTFAENENLRVPAPYKILPIGYQAYSRFLLVAALVVISFIGGFFSYNMTTSNENQVNLEKFIVAHFEKGSINQNWIPISNDHTSASDFLVKSVGWNPNIPPVANAQFDGLFAFPISSNTISHVFAYTLSDGQPLYVFAMPVNIMQEKSNIAVTEEAFSFCAKSENYFIENVNGKHVVSWRWKNDWYSAVSNHNGKDIAALLPN